MLSCDVTYQIIPLVFKFLIKVYCQGCQPGPVSPTKGLLDEHSFKLETYRRCAYFVVGPSFWNDLPVDLRFEDNLTCFKSSLKTHLFTL